MKTDEQLQHDVTDELAWDPAIDARRIAVEVRDGVAILGGQVGSYAQKCHAGCAAQRVAGVRGVAMELDVELPEADRRPDDEIAAAAHNTLAWHASVPRGSVKVTVKHGWIMLSGTVEWEYQSRAAEAAVRNLVGIRGLVNLVEIKPTIEPHDVTRQIEAALRRRAVHRAHHLSVVVNGGTVTLSGELDSWSERRAARGTAWNAPGIRNVVDHTTIAA
jgi:osmotically-inducible protein OsmY